MKTFTLTLLLGFFFLKSFSQLSVTVTPQNAGCSGQCNGYADVYVTGGNPPYTYNLNPATGVILDSSWVQIYNLCGGVYTLTTTDQNSVAVQTTFTIVQAPALTVTITSITNASCNGICDGQATAMVSGGNPPYNYYWPSGNTNSANSYSLCAGMYSVYFSDANGCSAFTTFSVAQGTGIANATASLTSYDESCINSNDGAINVTISGSNPGPFTYNWSNGATTQNIANLNTGHYSTIIFDATMNCIVLHDSISFIGTNCGSISGNVSIDNNTDCINNIGDQPSLAYILVNPGNRYGYTNGNGDYIINNLPYGNYNITAINWNPNLVASCTTTLTSAISVGNPNSLNNNFFNNFKSSTQPDMQVSGWSTGIIPGFTCSMNYHLFNLNNVNCAGKFKATLPSAFIPNITSASPGTYTISGDTIMWDYSNVTYSSQDSIFVVHFTVPLSTSLGSTFTSCMYATTNITDFNPSNNVFCYSRVVTGSFDPNDKSVSPIGMGTNGGILETETDLTYLIRFQNTGNGPAVNIVVKDSISPNLDIKSLQMLSSSHNYNIEILEGNVIKWKFNNIMLPDSGNNEPDSHGYIRYSIKRTNNNVIGSEVKNTALIYFDFNEPVITNTTLNTIVAPLGIIEDNKNKGTWIIYPNPSNGTLYLNNNSPLSEENEIQISNTIGQTVYHEATTSNHKTIDLNKFNDGIYFVKVVSTHQTSVQKIILSK